MTVSLLPDRLRLLRFPRDQLGACSHAILKHILFRDYSHAHRQHGDDPLFSYIDNSLEISIFGDANTITRDFTKDLCPGLEISNHIYRALQVDNDDTFNSSRICTIVEPLAKAGVSIFYMSTYQTDLLFVQEGRLPIVFTTLSKYGLHIACDEDSGLTSSEILSSDGHRFRKYDIHDIQEEDCSGYISDDDGQRQHQMKHASDLGLATPPESRESRSDDDENAEGTDRKQVIPLNIVCAQRHDKEASAWSESLAGNERAHEDMQLAKASPTTATTLELRQQAIRTLPENNLRCVGLNTELETEHQPWILKIIKILFYHDKIKEEAARLGRQPTREAPRFFSFTATSECVSMITDTYILEEFEEHELFMDMETCPLRLIQLDLQRFGLDKYGIIHSVARPLTEAGIDLLYLSTFSTANILVAEHRLSEAERILGGSGASTPENVASEDEDEGKGDDE